MEKGGNAASTQLKYIGGYYVSVRSSVTNENVHINDIAFFNLHLARAGKHVRACLCLYWHIDRGVLVLIVFVKSVIVHNCYAFWVHSWVGSVFGDSGFSAKGVSLPNAIRTSYASM